MAANEELNKSDFTGGALAHFGMGIVAGFVSLITLGIAAPFMIVWRTKWIANHTYIDGRQLVFDGNGGQLLGNYVKWILLSIITLGIYAVLCMPLNMTRWTTKHTHFADVEGGESVFDGHIWEFFGARWLANFVTIITLGLGAFWAHCYLQRWIAKHTKYDGAQLVFDGKGMEYFGKCIVWMLLTIITLGIYSIWRAVKEIKWNVSHTHIEG